MFEMVAFFLFIEIIGVTATKEVTCNKTTGKCRCPENPLTENYGDPSDPTCRNYYLCHLGHAFLRMCEVRTAFHPTERYCMSRQRIPESLCQFAVQCNHNGYMADPEDCTKYYLCFYEQPFHYGCQDDHVFDEVKKSCVRDKLKAEKCPKLRP